MDMIATTFDLAMFLSRGGNCVQGDPRLPPLSESQVATVRKYIQRQDEHQEQLSFKDELISLLRRHRIDFDERDLLD
jgi:hypothetical protein